MTEYDFSPAAYEKFLSTQLRVSNWVSSQSDHTQNYGNPFMPSTYISPKPLPKEQSSRNQIKSPPRSRSSTTSAPSSTTTPTKSARQPPVRSQTTRDVRPEPRHTQTRSMTMPAHQAAIVHPVNAGQTVVLPTSSHRRHDRHESRRSSPHRSSSNKSPSKSSHHSSRYDRSHHHRSSSTSRAHTTDRDAPGRRVIRLENGSHSRVLHLPPPQHGEQYVIIPSPGEKVGFVNPQTHQVEYRHEYQRDRPRHQEKHPEPTFFKRIFGGFGLTGGSRNSSRSKSRSSSHRRRSSY